MNGEFSEDTPSSLYDIAAREAHFSQRFCRMITLVGEIKETANSLGMLDARVFHSLDMPNESSKLSVASDRLRPMSHYNNKDYLGLVINYTREDPFSRNDGLIFASEFLVGLKSHHRTISTNFDFVRLTDDGEDYLSGKGVPGVIWGSNHDEFDIFRGKKFKIKLPRDIHTYSGAEIETIETQV